MEKQCSCVKFQTTHESIQVSAWVHVLEVFFNLNTELNIRSWLFSSRDKSIQLLYDMVLNCINYLDILVSISVDSQVQHSNRWTTLPASYLSIYIMKLACMLVYSLIYIDFSLQKDHDNKADTFVPKAIIQFIYATSINISRCVCQTKSL